MNGHYLILQGGEHKVLNTLCQGFSEAITKEEFGYFLSTNSRPSCEMRVSNLRKAFKKFDVDELEISTVRYKGYMLYAVVEEEGDQQFTYHPNPYVSLLKPVQEALASVEYVPSQKP